MRLAILGGGCPFGLNLSRYMIERGHSVIGIGRSPTKTEWPYFRLHISDNFHSVIAAIELFRPDVVVNFAALGERAASFDHSSYSLYYQTNVSALAKLQGALHGRPYLKRFIQISSGEVYGPCLDPATEETPLLPTAPYAVSKAAFDMHLLAVARQLGFPMNILRPCNLYCEGQQPHRIVPKAIAYAMTGKRLPLNGGGVSRKMYMHATDLSRAVELIIEKAPAGEVYNLSPDFRDRLSFLHHRVGAISVRELVEMVAYVTGCSMEDLIEERPARRGADAQYLFNSRKANALGWHPTISMLNGLESVRRWTIDNLDVIPQNEAHYLLRA